MTVRRDLPPAEAREAAPPGRPCRVAHVLPDLATGGGQQVVLRTTARLDSSRVKTFICYFRPVHDLRRPFDEAGAEVRFFDHRGGWACGRALRQTVRFLRRERIDVVHVHGTPADTIYGQAAALRCGLPVVRTLHGPRFRAESLGGLLRRPRPGRVLRWVAGVAMLRLVRALDKRTLRHAVAVADSVLDSWREYLDAVGLPPESVTVSYNGVSVDDDAASRSPGELAELRRRLGIDDAFPVLINVGRLGAGKGQDLLVEMMPSIVRRWPSARLLIAGEGNYRPELERAIERCGASPHVRLLGHRDDVPALLTLGDAFVFGSHFEGFPLCILEAFAAGTPVVSVDLPGLDRVVEHGVNGYLVQERSAERLAGAVLELFDDAAQARRMGRRGRDLVRREFTIGLSAEKLEGIYRKMLGERLVPT